MAKDEQSKLDKFLSRNTIKPIDGIIPLVHSTKSYNLPELLEVSGLDPKQCDVYGEKLTYFFLGRPAYRSKDAGSEPAHWELPTCFIFDNLPTLPVKRVLPFDSGAFAAGLYPSYLNSIPRTEFESTRPDAPKRLVSAFFGSFGSYVKGEPKSLKDLQDEFELDASDAEVLAIQRLAQDGTPSGFDDRRFSIEIQTGAHVDFANAPPSAVILPTVYLDVKGIREKIESWGAQVINYETYSLNLSMYYGIIFLKFKEYCAGRGIVL